MTKRGLVSLGELNFWDDLPQQDEVVRVINQKIPTKSGITRDTKTVSFEIQTSSNQCLDFKATRVITKFRIKKLDAQGAAQNVEAGDMISTVNFPGGAVWKQCDLYFDNQQVSTHPYYAYKTYAETMCTFSILAKKSWLQAGLYYEDTPDKHEELDAQNKGFMARKKYIEDGKDLVLETKLHCDLANQEKFIVPNTVVNIVLTRNAMDFFMMAADAQKLQFELLDVYLEVAKYEISDAHYIQYQKLLSKNNIIYNYASTEIYPRTVNQGLLNANIRPIFKAKSMPMRILICAVDNDSFIGRQSKNPFNFQHFNLSEINVQIDGRTIHATPQKFDMKKGDWLHGFMNLYKSLGYDYQDDGCAIDRDSYGKGNFLLGYYLGTTQTEGQYRDPEKAGELSIDLLFSEALPSTVTFLVFAEFEKTLKINSMKQVFVQ